ncbi:lamin tail domain-containing protein [Candidatus Parcubacteria bacterium]|nr:lamin tail domain-containing protein [Candidatus Parcubacteria bacterium]
MKRGAGGSDILILIGVMLFLMIVWFGNGRPSATKASGPIQQPATKALTTTKSTTLPKIDSTATISTDLNKAAAQAQKLKQTIIETSGNSPFKNEIVIEPANPYSEKTQYEYLRLRSAETNHGAIDISGWTLTSTVSGKTAHIPQGTYLPNFFDQNYKGDINLGPGETVYIVTGTSPIGTSFKINMCTGFFEQYNSFSPALPQQCPRPSLEKLPRDILADTACTDYLDNFPYCRMNTDSLSDSGLSLNCREYILNHINYNECVTLHQKDTNFYSKQWRVYLGQTNELWKTGREHITLTDKNGLLVSEISY